MAFFAKFRRKLRTKNFEAHFHRKLRTLEKCSNVKKLRTVEPQPIFTGSYKKKKKSVVPAQLGVPLVAILFHAWEVEASVQGVSLVTVRTITTAGVYILAVIGYTHKGKKFDHFFSAIIIWEKNSTIREENSTA